MRGSVVSDRPAPSRGLARVAMRAGWAATALLVVALSLASFVEMLGERSLDVMFRGGILALNEQMRGGLAQLGLSDDVILNGVFIFRLGGLIVFTATGALIFFRRPDDRMTAIVSAMLMLLGVSWFAPINVLSEISPWQEAVRLFASASPWQPSFANSLPGVVLIVFLFTFPNGRFVPRWTRVAAALAAGQLALTIVPGWEWGLQTWPETAQVAWIAALGVCGLGSQAYRYFFVSTARERGQTLFVLGGIASISVLPPLLQLSPRLGEGLSGLTLVTPRTEAIYELILLVLLGVALLMLPVSIVVAVMRHGLWDIKFFVNRALVYGALTGLVAVVYLAGILLLGGVLGLVLGRLPASNIAILASTVAATLLFQPARRRLQRAVDRRFFREKYDAVRTLQTFSDRVRDDVDLTSLVDDLLSVVNETMQPAHVSLQLRTDKGALLSLRARRTREPEVVPQEA